MLRITEARARALQVDHGNSQSYNQTNQVLVASITFLWENPEASNVLSVRVNQRAPWVVSAAWGWNVVKCFHHSWCWWCGGKDDLIITEGLGWGEGLLAGVHTRWHRNDWLQTKTCNCIQRGWIQLYQCHQLSIGSCDLWIRLKWCHWILGLSSQVASMLKTPLRLGGGAYVFTQDCGTFRRDKLDFGYHSKASGLWFCDFLSCLSCSFSQTPWSGLGFKIGTT